MDYLQRLFRSRSWQTLIPDFENRIITSGYWYMGNKRSCVSAITSDANTIIAYLPSKRSITVDMSKIHGSEAKCWWYNPSDGKATEIGTYCQHRESAVLLQHQKVTGSLLLIMLQQNFLCQEVRRSVFYSCRYYSDFLHTARNFQFSYNQAAYRI